MQRFFTNLLVEDVERAALFYEELIGMKRHFNSDWFIILTHEDTEGLEFGLLKRSSDMVPAEVRSQPSGIILTAVVDDCDAAHQRALAMKADIVSAPTDMPYGQRRMLVRDPDGTVVDVSAPTAPVLSMN